MTHAELPEGIDDTLGDRRFGQGVHWHTVYTIVTSMAEQAFVSEELLCRVPGWRNYFAAKLGFRNHWYPIRFARDLAEGQVLEARLCGENILLKRIDGRVFAIRDRCIHRGVRLSARIECYTKQTISCWYHGFTYKWDSGLLCDIIAAPTSSAIGRRKIKVYPAEEAKGLIFVFLGDEGYPTPALSTDVPPFFLDPDMHIQGWSYPVNSNWRIGCENGYDALHIYIHRESPLVPNTQRSLPLGNVRTEFKHELLEEEGGPKGIRDATVDSLAAYEGLVEGKVVVSGTKRHVTPEEARSKRTTGSFMCLPGVLRVDNFPYTGLTQFEWYVPVTPESHLYVITVGRRCAVEAERTELEHEFWHRWKPVSLEGFNNQDIMAREALQSFYGVDRNWLEERLIFEDTGILKWRELAHRHGRGVQLPRHLL
jgi:carbazole 1,9a-dioxygenase terminal dioxygenase component